MKNIFILFLLLIITVSCDLDDIEPQQSISLDAAFADETAIRFALNGMYDAYQDDDVGATFITMSADLMANRDMEFRGSFTSLQEIRSKTLVTSNVQVSATWIDTYETINAANAIIEAIEANPDLEEGAAGAARGQSLAMRAYLHFELVRLYGETPFVPGSTVASNTQLGVPIILEATLSSDGITRPARNTVAEVYQRVLDDLAEAITLMEANGGGGQGQIDTEVAKSMLARVYLQMGDYANVLTVTDDIIATGGFSLVPDIADFFAEDGEFSSESIFEVSNLDDDGPPGQTLTDFYSIDGRDDVIASEAYLALEAQLFNDRLNQLFTDNNYTVMDHRYSELLVASSNANDTDLRVNKYEDAENEADNTPVFRYAEILLSNAEANVRENGRSQGALDLLNEVRNRSIRVEDELGLPVDNAASYELADFTTDQEMIDAILLERRVELAFEGYAFHDLTRLNSAPEGFSFGEGRLAWPIPQRERDVNGNLEQNPAYR
ncbi:MAG: RagB/SusD family nutrient uptake outer membrane protein [Cytophagales bacterium]|nr:RagB/SusD family nutrient uptake outer membrane protein [Cytophagales bacterium]